MSFWQFLQLILYIINNKVTHNRLYKLFNKVSLLIIQINNSKRVHFYINSHKLCESESRYSVKFKCIHRSRCFDKEEILIIIHEKIS